MLEIGRFIYSTTFLNGFAILVHRCRNDNILLSAQLTSQGCCFGEKRKEDVLEVLAALSYL